MEMRKFVFILVFVMVFTITGCSNAKPDATVKNFIEAGKVFDTETMASYINPANKTDNNELSKMTPGDASESTKYVFDYLKSNASKITYKIGDSKIGKTTATVKVAFKYIDATPLFNATIEECFAQAMQSAFSGVESTDEETGKMIVDAMKKQEKIVKKTYVEKTIGIKCIKVDDKWYIDKPSEALLDVFMSNFLTFGGDLGLDAASDDSQKTVMEQFKEDNMTVFKKAVGDEITFATIKLKVNSVKETNSLSAEYSEPTVAAEGAKFVVLNVDVTNITNSEFDLGIDDMILVDNKGREFNTYPDAMFAIDDSMDYRTLAPSIKESGKLVYELPLDASSYFLPMGKSGTDELYEIILK